MRREKQSRSLSEIRMLAKAYAKENKGRNYLLFLQQLFLWLPLL